MLTKGRIIPCLVANGVIDHNQLGEHLQYVNPKAFPEPPFPLEALVMSVHTDSRPEALRVEEAVLAFNLAT